MSKRRTPPWPLLALGAACAGAIVAAVLLVGPAPAEQASVTRTATVVRGVVQSTVSGSGNLAPASQLDLGFATAGTIAHVYVHEGERVVKGQLLATLDPQSAEVTLQQARANLQSAEATLAVQEETDGEGTSRQASSTPSAASASAAATTRTTPEQPSKRKSGNSEKATKKSSESSEANSTLSTATREANIASARAAVRSERLAVHSDEQAVANTRLYAPEDGTIASLSGQVGEVVSGSGTSRATGSEPSSSSASSASSRGGASTGGATSNASSSSGGSSFAVLTDLSSMRLVVPLSESEISSVHRGQIATVTVEALAGRKLAAHVGEVAILSTSNSGVVSYDVTFVLDQTDEALKPGMSASAEVVVEQAQGLNVPSSAISRGSVTVLKGSARGTRQVVTGLAGDTSTIVRSGLKAGETVVLPSAATSSTGSSATSALRRLRGLGGGLSGGIGAGGGAGPVAVPGGGAFRREGG